MLWLDEWKVSEWRFWRLNSSGLLEGCCYKYLLDPWLRCCQKDVGPRAVCMKVCLHK